MQMFAIVVSLAITAVALVMTTRAVRQMLGVIRIGQPASRTDKPGARTVTMLKESMLHTRMLQWHWVGALHWFVYAAFLFLSSAVAAGFVQLFDPMFEIPVVGKWYLYGWPAEFLGLFGTLGIIGLIIYRQVKHPRTLGRRSRFFGSNFWQAYFVEGMVLLESAAILFIRGAEYKLHDSDKTHFPLSHLIGGFYPDSDQSLKNIVFFVAMVKVTSAMLWLIVISSNLTMGIAWHRFTAWFNIFFKRESDGGTALGAMKPLTSGGKAITLDDIDDLDEDATLGVGTIEDFSWKGLLDFTTCTECGRCQSQCPAWNTEKPLSPKLLIMALRDHAYAKAPYVQAGGEGSEAATALLEHDETLAREVARPIIGPTGDEWFYMPEDGSAVIDTDALWNCTSCGACVQQCPVDIEHVDHIMDMRRYQVLVESNFPAELNGLFKALENKGNPWSMSSTARMDWAKGLDFDVPVVGEDIESLDSVDWLFWVGCAGAYEDRAKKTTRAVAELLNIAGISFGVLGNGETCTGDPARRAGNEFVFQGLAQQNIETFKEFKVKKVVSTCAHCFNTLKNEYKDFGIELEVVHHTQLLNRLVREGKLTPVKEGAGAAKRSITYHDPCFLGRHNDVYTPPRELLEILPGAEYVEMERHSEKSFCCGAGGARMWMEENIGERINLNRTKEAVGTGADQIAVGCPFCRVMLSDGLTAQQAAGEAREEVEVLDVAQMLLASVKGEQATKLAPGASAAPSPSASPATAKSATASVDVATKAEPEPGDVTVTDNTVTETADVGPAAKASGGSSLFDTPAEAAPEAKPAPTTSGGSLFDTPADPAPEAKTQQPKTEPAKAGSADDLGSGGSLFDLETPSEPTAVTPDPTSEPAAKSEPTPQPAATPAADLGSGGSLFDLAAPAPVAESVEPAPVEAEPVTPVDTAVAVEPSSPEKTAATSSGGASTPTTDVDISGLGSLFDVAAPASVTPDAGATAPAAPEPEPAAAEAAASSAVEEPAAEEPAAAPDVPAGSGATSTPNTGVDIGGLGSLFDVAAPTVEGASPSGEPASFSGTENLPPAPPEAAEKPKAIAEEQDDSAVAPGAPPSGAELSQAATQGASADESPATATAETAAESVAEPEVSEPSEAGVDDDSATETTTTSESSGEAHQPRTDVEISGASSLFDL